MLTKISLLACVKEPKLGEVKEKTATALFVLLGSFANTVKPQSFGGLRKFGPAHASLEALEELPEDSRFFSQNLLDVSTHEELSDYILKSPDLKETPCIIPREVWDDSDTVDKVKKEFVRVLPDGKKVPARAENAIAAIMQGNREGSFDNPKVGFLPPQKVTKIVMHHSMFPAHYGPREILNYHVNSNGWVDIGYHYIVARKPPSESELLRELTNNKALTDRQKFETAIRLREQSRLFREDLLKMRAHLENIGEDPELCPLGAEWVTYEARPSYLKGAHAGTVRVSRVEGSQDLFELTAYRPKKLPSGDIQKDDNGNDVYELYRPTFSPLTSQLSQKEGSKPLLLKFVPGDDNLHSLVQVQESGKKLPFGHKIDFRSSKVKIFDENGDLKNDISEAVSISLNDDSIGVLLAGNYSPQGESPESNFGYDPQTPVAMRLPEQEAVKVYGQTLNQLFKEFSNADTLLGHRSGHFHEHINGMGGECPGPEGMRMARLFKTRFAK